MLKKVNKAKSKFLFYSSSLFYYIITIAFTVLLLKTELHIERYNDASTNFFFAKLDFNAKIIKKLINIWNYKDIIEFGKNSWITSTVVSEGNKLNPSFPSLEQCLNFLSSLAEAFKIENCLPRKKESLNTVKEREKKDLVCFLHWPFETLKKKGRILRNVGLKGKEEWKKERNKNPINYILFR